MVNQEEFDALEARVTLLEAKEKVQKVEDYK